MRLLFKHSGFGGHNYQVGNNSMHFEYTYIHIGVHDIRGEVPNVIVTFQANHLFFIGCIRVCSKETRMDITKSKICGFAHTDKQTNHDSNIHTSRGFSYLQTLQDYYKEQHSVDTTQKQEFSCHVLCSDKLLGVYK
jgi:hypothetical protein